MNNCVGHENCVSQEGHIKQEGQKDQIKILNQEVLSHKTRTLVRG